MTNAAGPSVAPGSVAASVANQNAAAQLIRDRRTDHLDRSAAARWRLSCRCERVEPRERLNCSALAFPVMTIGLTGLPLDASAALQAPLVR